MILSLAAEAGIAGLEVFLDRQQREDLAALRHVADAEAGALVGRRLLQHVVVEDDLARGDVVDAGDGAQRRALADAVAAEHGGDPAGPGTRW